jgi:hypothetical protein
MSSSFGQESSRPANQPNTRVILRLGEMCHQEDSWSHNSVESLKRALGSSGSKAEVIKSTHNIYVDAGLTTAAVDDALEETVRLVDSALLATLVPAELKEARIGSLHDFIPTQTAWELLTRDPSTEVTARAQIILEEHRSLDLSSSIDRLLFEV